MEIEAGIAIIIKKGIKFNLINLNNDDKVFEKTIISIKFKTNKILYIILMYAKKRRQTDFITKLKNLFERLDLKNLTNYYIITVTSILNTQVG